MGSIINLLCLLGINNIGLTRLIGDNSLLHLLVGRVGPYWLISVGWWYQDSAYSMVWQQLDTLQALCHVSYQGHKAITLRFYFGWVFSFYAFFLVLLHYIFDGKMVFFTLHQNPKTWNPSIWTCVFVFDQGTFGKREKKNNKRICCIWLRPLWFLYWFFSSFIHRVEQH